jgi:hypothetical protein
MQDAGYAALQIIPSFDGFQSKLEHGSSGALVAAGTSGGRKYGDAAGRSMASAFTAHAKRAALLTTGLLTVSAAAIFKIGKDSLAEARESQKVGALTAQVIKTTGQAAGVTANEVGRLAEKLSLKTGVDDEVIQRGANMLLTFKNVRNEVGKNNDIFSQGVAVAEDMSAAMAGGQGGNKLDLKSSSILVGKALNDPAKGLTALTRVGVTFTEQQKKNIESLLEHNKVSDAQKVILRELQSEFGGAAEAQATMGEKVDVAWGNLEEKFGTALIPLIEDVQGALLTKGLPAAEKFVDWFQNDGVSGIHAFVDETKPLAHELLPAMASALGDVRDVAKDALPYAKGIVEAFNDMPDWAKKGLAVGGLGALAAQKTGASSLLLGSGGAKGGLLGAISKAAPLPVVVTNPGFGAPGVPGVGGKPGAIPPILPSGAPGGAKFPGLFTTLGLAAGVTYGSKDSHAGDHATFDHVGSESDFMAATAPRRAAGFKAWIDESKDLTQATKALIGGQQHLGVVVTGNEDKVADYGNTLGRTGQKKVAPRFTTPGLPESKNSSQQLLTTLTGLDRSFRPRISVDTGDSFAQINAVRAAIANLPAIGSYGNGLGVVAAPKPAPKKSGGKGPSGRRHMKLMVGDQEFNGYVGDLIGSDRDLEEETRRAGQ